MRARFTLCLFASLTVATGPAISAAKAPSKSKAMPAAEAKPIEIPYSSSQLDYSTAQLPAEFRGHSCRAVAKSLAQMNPAKGEFETTAAYNERTANIAAAPVIGSLKAGDYFGFIDSKPLASVQYNADAALMHIKLFMLPTSLMSGTTLVASIPVESTVTSTSTYPASNAYGKSVEVKKTSVDACALAFQNYSASKGTFLRNFDVDVTMTPDDARKSKADLAYLYVGVLAHPYLLKYSYYSKPTIDDPTEAVWSGDAVSMKLLQVWVFNKHTGQVYKKIDTQAI